MKDCAPLVSVIIPVFNGEEYISECLESVKNQSYKNIEIIIIDDGSTDRTSSILKQYEMSSNNIYYRRYKNEGLSVSRNRGLLLAKSDYVFFVDSDDCLKSDAISIMMDEMQSCNADIVISSAELIDNKGEVINNPKTKCLETKTCSGVELLGRLSENWVNVVSWGKLYKKELFKDIKFEPAKQHEDEFIIHHLLIKSKIIRTLSRKLYLYRKHQNSIMSMSSQFKKLDFLEAMNDRYELCMKNNLDKGMLDVGRSIIGFCRSIFENDFSNIKEVNYFKRFEELLFPWSKRKDLLFRSCPKQIGRRAVVRKIIYIGNKNKQIGNAKLPTIKDSIYFGIVFLIKIFEKLFYWKF